MFEVSLLKIVISTGLLRVEDIIKSILRHNVFDAALMAQMLGFSQSRSRCTDLKGDHQRHRILQTFALGSMILMRLS